jgi:serine O-acetyltransferase
MVRPTVQLEATHRAAKSPEGSSAERDAAIPRSQPSTVLTGFGTEDTRVKQRPNGTGPEPVNFLTDHTYDQTSSDVRSERDRPPGLWQLIAEDFEAHDRDWTKPGFRALAVHRFGNWRSGINSRLLRAPFSMIYRSLYRFVRNVYGIELPYPAVVGRGVVIEHQGGIVVHGNAVIGDGCILRQGVTLGNKNLHAPNDAPVLGKHVNVGAGAVILGKVTGGDGAQIGANAVVIRSVPAGAVAVGNPARIVGRAEPPVAH